MKFRLFSLCLVVVFIACAPAEDASIIAADFATLRALDPRTPGSLQHHQAQTYISEQLQAAGWRVERDGFDATPLEGDPVPMMNLIAVKKGRGDKLTVLATHYDTKPTAPGYVADGASGAAVLLDVARNLPNEATENTVWLVFFDGHEPFGDAFAPRDGLYGSRQLASKMERDGSLTKIDKLFVVDRVGGTDLKLAMPFRFSADLLGDIAEAAADLGHPELVDLKQPRQRLWNDHKPFFDKGVREVMPVVGLVNGRSEESMRSVSRVVKRLVNVVPTDF